jgi:hypothetical protein
MLLTSLVMLGPPQVVQAWGWEQALVALEGTRTQPQDPEHNVKETFFKK